ncbi:MAG TPA: DinB family protein [Blastocatellia bacterium]|nr:DinB family protein [Blastocatellia bacterium]
MKNTIAVLVCIIFLSALAQGVTPPGPSDGKLTPEERAKAIKMLVDSQNEFLSYVEKLSDEQWNFRPAPFKWTVGETAEHIALAEGLLFSAVERALATPVNPDWETKSAGKESLLDNLLAARKGKANAPEPIQPFKRKMTRAEIMTMFKEGRAKSLKFAEQTDLPLKAHTFDHPFPVFGTLNAYQWLLYIPAHNLRHDKQIAEIMSNPAFPAFSR